MNKYILDYKKEAVRRVLRFQEVHGRNPQAGESKDWLRLHTLLEQEMIEGWQYMRSLKALAKEIEAGRVDEASVDLTANVKPIMSTTPKQQTKVSSGQFLSKDEAAFHKALVVEKKPVPVKPVAQPKPKLFVAETPRQLVTPRFVEAAVHAPAPRTEATVLMVHAAWAQTPVEISVPAHEDVDAYLQSRQMTRADAPARAGMQIAEPALA